MTKPYSIQLKPKADDDLASIYLYSFNSFGKTKAVDYIADINKALISISQGVAVTYKCDLIKPKLQKLIINSHVIFFKSVDRKIEIIRILHQSQDFQRYV